MSSFLYYLAFFRIISNFLWTTHPPLSRSPFPDKGRLKDATIRANLVVERACETHDTLDVGKDFILFHALFHFSLFMNECKDIGI